MSILEQDGQAEQGFLGSILKEPDRMDDVSELMIESDFDYPSHQMLWTVMKWLHERSKPISLASISDVLRRGNKVDEFGELSYIRELRESVPSAASISYYAETVKMNSAYRKAVKCSEDIMRMVHQREAETPTDLFQTMDKLMIGLHGTETGNLRDIASKREDFIHHITSSHNVVKTGLPRFDEWSGGIGRGWLYVMSGRPGVGKTAKAIQMAYHIATQDAGKVLFWSQEMSHEQLMERLVSNLSGVNYKRIVRKQMGQDEKDSIIRAYDRASHHPMFIEDTASVTIGRVRSAASLFKRKHGKIGAIVIDYLTRMDIKQEKNQNYAKAVGDVAKRCKWLAREMDCPVILLAQINREGEEGKPEMRHLKESGDIEQEADMIEILWKDSDQPSSDFMVINSSIVKGRFTGVNDFQYKFINQVQRYEDHMTEYAPNSEGLVKLHNGRGRKRG